MVTVRVHLPIKTAMEERQARERERYMRPIVRAASGDCKMSFYITPYARRLVRGGRAHAGEDPTSKLERSEAGALR